MKVLSVNKFYHVYGGSDRYFFELNELHSRAGHQVVPFAMRHPKNMPSPYDRYFVSEINFWDNASLREKFRAAGRVLYSVEARRRIRSLLEAESPNIAHVHLIYHQISPAILPVIKDSGIPVVQTLHDYKPICPTYSLVANGAICERCQGRRFFHATLQRCNRGSVAASFLNTIEMYLHHGLGLYSKMVDIFITPSAFMSRKMIEYGMPAEKLVHIPNFVDPSKYTSGRESGDYFVYVGRLVPIKGISTLLLAMKQISHATMRVLIIGDGPQRTELETIKARFNLANVEFKGYQSAGDLEALVAGAMFSVVPSEWYENCPMSVLESMAMGKPVIGAGIGGIPELIKHGEDGLLFEPGNVADLADKISYMLQNPRRCKAMGGAARQKIVAAYNPEVHYSRILELYDQVM